MDESLWFTTRSGLFEPGDGAWEEVALYDQPLRRLLARRYGRVLSPSQRDDLSQQILIEIKQKLTSTFDRSRGRFRALLQTVVARRVRDELRRARPGALTGAVSDDLEAPSEKALDALDLEGALVRSVGACRDVFSGGRTKDLEVLHAMTDRLVHGLSATQIARKEGVSRDRISRRLAKGREVIYTTLLANELELASEGVAVSLCADAFKRSLRKPGRVVEHVKVLGDEALAEQFMNFWGRFQAALPHFEGDETSAGRELAQGVELILGVSEE